MRNNMLTLVVCLGSTFQTLVNNEAFARQTTQVEPIVIESDRAKRLRKSGIQEGKIYSGKKNTQVILEEAGPLATNNYRQVAVTVPGLTIAEVNNESWASITYRGLGDPHESFNLLILEDGIPISADIYGYPAAYYQPPMDTISGYEFLRGGSALMYGPQAGGALNYLTHRAGTAPVKSHVRLLGGEFGYAQGFLQADGQVGDIDYVVNGHGRRSDGFRDSNGGYEVSGYNVKLGYLIKSDLKIRVKAQDYLGQHDEAGGLARTTTVDAIGIDRSKRATTSPYDQIQIDRNFFGLGIEYKQKDTQNWIFDIWHTNLGRSSFRQDYASGQDQFGTVKQGSTSDIVHQKFQTFGAQLQGISDTQINNTPLNLVYGYRYYANTNPLENQTGSTPNSMSGVQELIVENRSLSHSFFTEALLKVGEWSLSPGLRYEMIRQEIKEMFRSSNVALPGGDLRSDSIRENVLLYGLGIERKVFNSSWKVIANSSSGYTPAIFAEAFPLSPADQLNGDLEASRILTHEIGVAGEFSDSALLEVSTFYVTNSNQIGRVGNQFTNVGDAEYYGVEGVFMLDLFKEIIPSSHSLETTFGVSLMNSKFVGGPTNTIGKTPQYAPQQTFRWNFSYLHPSHASVTLSGQWLGNHFADDANTANFEIPQYSVWDLGAKIPLGVEGLNLQVAVRNLFDQNYFARIRSNGIEPGQPRIATAGLDYVF